MGQVHTSAFNRAVETGQLLGFGGVKPSLDFAEGGLVVTPVENNRRAQALRKIAATVPPAGSNVIVVTHRPNILDAFGKDWFDVREGEACTLERKTLHSEPDCAIVLSHAEWQLRISLTM